MKAAVLFLHGRYPKSELSFYKKLCLGKFKVAVNGGHSFFEVSKTIPDLLIGDFDSLKKRPSGKNKRTRVISFPAEKEMTDAELAVEYCTKEKFKEIDLVMPQVGEPDHFMGLISLLANPKVQKAKVRLVNHKFEIKLLNNSKLNFTGCNGDRISVKAVCEPISLTCTGCEYDARNLTVMPWQSRALRNRINSDKAVISVKGRALIFHFWGRR